MNVKINHKLITHHIGGRFGNGGFPYVKAFEDDIVRVYYDADSDCLAQIKEKHKKNAAETLVLNYCVGGADETGRFNINYDPTSSSLYHYGPQYGDFYFFCYNHDFIVSENMRVMETRDVDILTLDSIFDISGDSRVPPPDFLSLDAQGAEYSILQGAVSTLKQDVIALLMEVWFQPVYEGQKLFGDVSSFLYDKGFNFVKFFKSTQYSPCRYPTGQRGEGFDAFADALFLRRVEDLETSVRDKSLLRLMLNKLAFVSIVYGQFEYGLRCLEKASQIAVQPASAVEPVYFKFLKELEREKERMPKKFPPSFSEKFSYEASKKRFSGKESLGSRELSERLWLKWVHPYIYRIADIYDLIINRIWGTLASHLLPSSAIERVMFRYGLKEQARLLKKKRMVQSLFTRRSTTKSSWRGSQT